jgi:hypothetical protein
MRSLIVAAFDAPNADHLQHFSPEASRRVKEAIFVRIDQGSLPDQIGFTSLDELGSLDDFPDEEEGRDDNLHGIVRPEGGHGPRLICGVAVDDGHHDHPNECNVGAVGLEVSEIGQGSAVEPLRLARAVEEYVSQGDDYIIDET